MKTAIGQDLPARLEAIRRRLERWRQTRHGRSRIPASLWTSAVKAAGRYGLNPTARRWDWTINRSSGTWRQSDYRSDGPIGNARLGREAPAAFVELASPVVPGGLAECILELENTGGAKMRMHLKGVPVPDLAALSRSLWGGQA